MCHIVTIWRVPPQLINLINNGLLIRGSHYTYRYIRTYIHVCMLNIYIYVCIFDVYIYVYIYICVYTYIYTHVRYTNIYSISVY